MVALRLDDPVGEVEDMNTHCMAVGGVFLLVLFQKSAFFFVSCHVRRSLGHRNSCRFSGIKGGGKKNTQVCRDKNSHSHHRQSTVSKAPGSLEETYRSFFSPSWVCIVEWL